jgi:hypothetical protein
MPALTEVARKVEALLRGALRRRIEGAGVPAGAGECFVDLPRLASGSGSADRGASAMTDSVADRAGARHHRSLGTRKLIYDAAASGKPRACETHETASQVESALRNRGGTSLFRTGRASHWLTHRGAISTAG